MELEDNLAEVEAAFLAKLSGVPAGETTETSPEEAAEARAEAQVEDTAGTSEETGDAPEETAEAEAADETFAEDTHLVSIKIGEETRKVPVAELKGLFERNEAITRRDTETATTLAKLNEEGDKIVAIQQSLIERATKEFEPYSKIDFVDARHRLSDEAYNQLRKDAQTAFDRVSFLTQTGNQFIQQVQTNRAALLKQSIAKRDETLGKTAGVKWDDKTRSDVSAYAEKIGLGAGVLDRLDHPAPIVALYKAMLYDRGATAATAAVKNVATSATKTPTLRPGAAVTKTAKTAVESAMSRLSRSGSVDDAEAAFLAKFG